MRYFSTHRRPLIQQKLTVPDVIEDGIIATGFPFLFQGLFYHYCLGLWQIDCPIVRDRKMSKFASCRASFDGNNCQGLFCEFNFMKINYEFFARLFSYIFSRGYTHRLRSEFIEVKVSVGTGHEKSCPGDVHEESCRGRKHERSCCRPGQEESHLEDAHRHGDPCLADTYEERAA